MLRQLVCHQAVGARCAARVGTHYLASSAIPRFCPATLSLIHFRFDVYEGFLRQKIFKKITVKLIEIE